MNIGIVIQARMGSSRFPGKILEKVNGLEMIRFIYERLLKTNLPIVVATTTSSKDDVLADYLSNNNINFIRGSENNVLERYVLAAQKYNFDIICRVCSDSPFVDPDLISLLYKHVRNNPSHDYWSFELDNKSTVLSHIGVFSEFAKVTALEKLLLDSQTPNIYKEHVTNGLYNQNDIFDIYLNNIDNVFGQYINIRLTVDTPQDLQNINFILNNHPEAKDMSANQICELVNNHYELKSTMTQLINENKK